MLYRIGVMFGIGLGTAFLRPDMAVARVSTETSMTVRYGDLNLATRAGQAVFERRISSAVGALCRETGTGTVQRTRMNQCEAQARKSVETQLARLRAQ